MWGEARRAGGYKNPSIPTEDLAKGRGPVERADAKGSPHRLWCVRRCTPCSCFAEEFSSGKSSWLVVYSSGGLHLSVWMHASVWQAVILVGGFSIPSGAVRLWKQVGLVLLSWQICSKLAGLCAALVDASLCELTLHNGKTLLCRQ